MCVTHTVKDTAARVGLPSRTLRYYDRIGLVCPPRTPAGYRVYGPEDEGKLRFVRRARTLGFSLEQIRELIEVSERGSCSALVPEVERLLDEKIAAIDAQVIELGTFRERLVAFRAGGASGCGCSGHDAFCGCLGDVALADDTAFVESQRQSA
jgi:DNA-binding transcriptional MerR regulator